LCAGQEAVLDREVLQSIRYDAFQNLPEAVQDNDGAVRRRVVPGLARLQQNNGDTVFEMIRVQAQRKTGVENVREIRRNEFATHLEHLIGDAIITERRV